MRTVRSTSTTAPALQASLCWSAGASQPTSCIDLRVEGKDRACGPLGSLTGKGALALCVRMGGWGVDGVEKITTRKQHHKGGGH